MKNFQFYRMLVCIVLIISSCTPEEIPSTHYQFQSKSIVFPIESRNMYDEIGHMYLELYDYYYLSELSPASIEDLAYSIDSLITTHTSLPPTSIPIDSNFSSTLNRLIKFPESSLDSLSSNISLSTTTKSLINQITIATTVISDSNYSEIVSDIINLENNIVDNSFIVENEKIPLLILTSIIKYYIMDNGGQKDKDWDLSVGNIIAIYYGAVHSPQDALLVSLTLKIAKENDISLSD